MSDYYCKVGDNTETIDQWVGCHEHGGKFTILYIRWGKLAAPMTRMGCRSVRGLRQLLLQPLG